MTDKIELVILRSLLTRPDYTRRVQPFLHEDGYFCYQIRPQLKERGIRYAPFHISKRFAIESILEDCDNDINNVFGFHTFKHLNFDTAIAMLERGHT